MAQWYSLIYKFHILKFQYTSLKLVFLDMVHNSYFLSSFVFWILSWLQLQSGVHEDSCRTGVFNHAQLHAHYPQPPRKCSSSHELCDAFQYLFPAFKSLWTNQSLIHKGLPVSGVLMQQGSPKPSVIISLALEDYYSPCLYGSNPIFRFPTLT